MTAVATSQETLSAVAPCGKANANMGETPFAKRLVEKIALPPQYPIPSRQSLPIPSNARLCYDLGTIGQRGEL
jgi:hypothetical protein